MFPYRIPLITVFTDSAIMPQVVGDLDNQIPQFKFLCIFRRNPGKSYLSAYDVPGDRSGRVAVSVVIDGGNQRVVDISGILIVNAKSIFVLNRCQKAPYVISYTKEVRDIMKVRKYKNDPLELDRKLKGILKGNTDIELGYKLSFISMVLNGALPKDIAEYCVHDERAIQKWVKIADEQGFDALKRKKKEGRPPLLNPEQKAEIKAVLEDPNSLEEYGYCVWDGKTLSEFIKKWYDVDISVRNCQYLFHELGQSLKTPQTFPAHPENPKVREDFKKTLRIAEGSKQYYRVSRRGTFPASDKCDTNLVSYWYRSGGWFCAGQRKRCL